MFRLWFIIGYKHYLFKNYQEMLKSSSSKNTYSLSKLIMFKFQYIKVSLQNSQFQIVNCDRLLNIISLTLGPEATDHKVASIAGDDIEVELYSDAQSLPNNLISFITIIWFANNLLVYYNYIMIIKKNDINLNSINRYLEAIKSTVKKSSSKNRILLTKQQPIAKLIVTSQKQKVRNTSTSILKSFDFVTSEENILFTKKKSFSEFYKQSLSKNTLVKRNKTKDKIILRVPDLSHIHNYSNIKLKSFQFQQHLPTHEKQHESYQHKMNKRKRSISKVGFFDSIGECVSGAKKRICLRNSSQSKFVSRQLTPEKPKYKPHRSLIRNILTEVAQRKKPEKVAEFFEDHYEIDCWE